METIPGFGVVGFGFNIFKNYDQSSTTSQLFKFGKLDKDSCTLGDKTYSVPENISVVATKKKTGESLVFSSRQQVQDHFSAKAGITGSGFGFTGHVDASYSKIRNSSKDYFYALVESSDDAFTLKLKNSGASMLSDDFSRVMNALPAQFSKDNQAAFFAFFRTYGTHYVHQVKMGGSLHYSVAVEKSFSSDQTKIIANLSAEYEGLFSTVKVEADSNWKKLDKNWEQKRVVKVWATGGNSAVLDILEPQVGQWKGDKVKDWNLSLASNPGAVGFELRAITTIFPADKMTAAEEALDTYLNGGISVGAEIADLPTNQGRTYESRSTIICAGKVIAPPEPMPPPPKPGARMCGVQMAFFDTQTHAVIFNRAYYAPVELAGVTDIYRQMFADIKRFEDRQYYCAVSVFGMFSILYPSPEIAAWLKSCGASMTHWKELIGKTAAGAGYVCYSFVGKKGSAIGAKEDFKISPYFSTSSEPAITTNSTAKYFLYGGNLMQASKQ